MDLVLSVNTTYLACIVVVLLFVIYKLSVVPTLPSPCFDFNLTVDSKWHCFPPRVHSGLSPMSPVFGGHKDTLTKPAFLLGVWGELTDPV